MQSPHCFCIIWQNEAGIGIFNLKLARAVHNNYSTQSNIDTEPDYNIL